MKTTPLFENKDLELYDIDLDGCEKALLDWADDSDAEDDDRTNIGDDDIALLMFHRMPDKWWYDFPKEEGRKLKDRLGSDVWIKWK